MVHSSSLQQKTLGFLKPDVTDKTIELMTLIKSNDTWKVTFDKELHITLEQATLMYGKSTQDALWISSAPIRVFVLEGTNVIKRWLDFVGPKNPKLAKKIAPQSLRATYGLDLVRNVCHASGSEKEAQHDLVWLKSLTMATLSTLSETNTIDKSSKYKQSTGESTQKSTPSSIYPAISATRKRQSITSTPVILHETKNAAPLEKQPMTNHLPSSFQSTSKGQEAVVRQKKMGHTNRNGNPTSAPHHVTKTTKPSNNKHSSYNGRASKTAAGALDQKQNRLEKQKGAVLPTLDDSQKAQQLVDEKDINVDLGIKDTLIQTAMLSTANTPIATDEHDAQTPQATESIDTLSSTSSTCSQNTRNSDYDAEVAATTLTTGTTETTKCSKTPDLMDSNISPATSLIKTRSNSPEVGSLRQRFEHLARTHSTTTFTPRAATESIKRTSSFTPEIAYRIKDLKPKDPAGSRVKSMVEFFMDENLHKWEF